MHSLKLILFLIVVLFASSMMAQVNFRCNLGYLLPGTYSESYYDDKADYDTSEGFSVSAEMLAYGNDNFYLGAGISLQTAREIEVSHYDEKIEYNFIPIYAIGQFSATNKSKVIPHLNTYIGFSLLSGNKAFKRGSDPQVGFFWGVGFDLEFNNKFFTEIKYQKYSGSLSDPGYTEEIEIVNPTISLSLGIRL